MESTFEEENLFSNVKEEVFDFEESDVQPTKGKGEEFPLKQEEEVESFSAFNAHDFLSKEYLKEEDVEDDGVRVGQDESLNYDDGEKKCPMDGCSETASSSEDLVKHMKNHSAPWLCRICKTSWQFASKLRLHYITHTREKPFQCDVCGKRFSRSSILEVHLRIHNRSNKIYKCEFCEYKSTNFYPFTIHKRLHTGEKPNICPTCDKHFVNSYYLAAHMRIHSGEKLYACDKCEYKAIHLSVLKRHNLIHTGKKPFICACGFKTTSSWNLKSHQKYRGH